MDCDIWDVVNNGYFIPTHQVNDVAENKSRNLQAKEDKRKSEVQIES